MHLDYNDISFHTKSIVISRISLHQKGASGFHHKFSYQKVKKPFKISLIHIKTSKVYVKYNLAVTTSRKKTWQTVTIS